LYGKAVAIGSKAVICNSPNGAGIQTNRLRVEESQNFHRSRIAKRSLILRLRNADFVGAGFFGTEGELRIGQVMAKLLVINAKACNKVLADYVCLTTHFRC
jgi:hypothetical protein